MELTKEQIEKAAEAFETAWTKYGSRNMALEAAAPFLQMPIADLSSEEMDALAQKHERGWIYPVSAFIAMRNAALQAKPDLREYQIKQALLNSGVLSGRTAEVLTQKVLAIIDAHKGGE